jgi:hypothetical protein
VSRLLLVRVVFGGRRHRLSSHHRSMFQFRFVCITHTWFQFPYHVPYLTLWHTFLFYLWLLVSLVVVDCASVYVCSYLEFCLTFFWVNSVVLLKTCFNLVKGSMISLNQVCWLWNSSNTCNNWGFPRRGLRTPGLMNVIWTNIMAILYMSKLNLICINLHFKTV